MDLSNFMFLIPILLDIGNVVYFVTGMLQFRTAYRERKKGLKALSLKFLLGYALGAICFSIVGFLTGAYLTCFLNIVNMIVFATQAHWKRKYS